jgi:hypothetical protein
MATPASACLLASLGHRSEASRGRESWSAWACAPVWGQDPLVSGDWSSGGMPHATLASTHGRLLAR